MDTRPLPLTPLAPPRPWPLAARRITGALVALLGLAGLAWTVLSLTAEVRFQRVMNSLQGAKITREELVLYAEKLRGCIRLDPANGEIRNMYASMLGRLEDCAPAVSQLQIARLTLNTRNTLYFLSDMYERLGNITRAEQAMADCLLINPTDTEFNPGLLHLLGLRIYEMNQQKPRPPQYGDYLHRYAEAALGWSIRAANDKNAFLFLGNYYMNPLYAQQAYRCFMVGLSEAPWLDLNPRFMVNPAGVIETAHKLLQGGFARPYKDMP